MLLNEMNYSSWKTHIQQRLQHEGLLSITLGNEPEPGPHAHQREIEEFDRKSRLAFYTLIKSIDDSLIIQVSEFNVGNNNHNPNKLWNLLAKRYLSYDLSEKLEQFRILKSIQFKSNSDSSEFIQKIRVAFAEIERVGFKFDESTWMVLFLSQLPKHITDAILSDSDQATSAGSSHPSISSCEDLFRKLASLSTTSSNKYQKPSAQFTANHTHPKNHPVPDNQFLTCTKCHKRGHDINRCWIVHPELNPFANGNQSNPTNPQAPYPNKFKKAPKPFGNHQQTENPGNHHYKSDKNFNRNTYQGGINHERVDSSSNSHNITNEPNSFNKKPFKQSSGGQSNWGPPTQEPSNESGWDDPVQQASSNHQSDCNQPTSLSNESGWGDTTQNHTNGSGWTDHVQDFDTLPPNTNWGDENS